MVQPDRRCRRGASGLRVVGNPSRHEPCRRRDQPGARKRELGTREAGRARRAHAAAGRRAVQPGIRDRCRRALEPGRCAARSHAYHLAAAAARAARAPRALGPIAGQQVADTGRRLLALPEYVAQRFADSLGRYVADEAQLVVGVEEARAFAAEVAATSARVDTLAARIDALAEK